MKKLYTITLFLTLLIGQIWAQPGQLSLANFATGFNAPVDITHAGDERIFVVEQDGIIYILNQAGVRTPTPFLNIDPRVNSASSERGLLGLAFHPDYKQNGYFFVNYTNSAGNTVVSRFSVTSNPDIADPNSEEILLTITQPYSNHNGGCIKFGDDGYLYIGMGDGGSGGDPGNRAQNPQELLGKMLRIDVDGALPYEIPPSNPYYGSSSVRNEIWAFGVRNPWRYSFDRVTYDMWIGDVGQNQLEEIDFWADTATTFPNFGWRCYEANSPYNTAGCQAIGNYDFPIYEFSHTQNNCSVTGGYVYRGARYQSLWGYYFHTDYCGGYLWWTHQDSVGTFTTTRSTNAYSANNLASFGEDVYGELYLAGNSNGIIYHLKDTTCTPSAYIPGGDTVYACQPGGTITAFGGPTLTYQWQLSGVDVPGATSASITPATVGDYRVIVSNGSCRDTSNSVYINFAPTPVVSVSFADTALCTTDPAASAILVPPGGHLMGNGVSGTMFDPSVAGVGTHTLVYNYTDSATGCWASDTAVLTVTVCVGMANPMFSELSLSPNPNNGSFQLQFLLANSSDYAVEVLDLQGRSLKGLQFTAGAGRVTRSLQLPDLAAGNYFLKLTIGEQVSIIKFAVQK